MFHCLDETEIREFYLDKLDTHQLHICISTKVVYRTEEETIWGWDLFIYEMKYDDQGRLSSEYYADSNKAIFDSTKLSEPNIYRELRKLVRKYPRPARDKKYNKPITKQLLERVKRYVEKASNRG